MVTLNDKDMVTLNGKDLVTLNGKDMVTLYGKDMVTFNGKDMVTLNDKDMVTLNDKDMYLKWQGQDDLKRQGHGDLKWQEYGALTWRNLVAVPEVKDHKGSIYFKNLLGRGQNGRSKKGLHINFKWPSPIYRYQTLTQPVTTAISRCTGQAICSLLQTAKRHQRREFKYKQLLFRASTFNLYRICT